MAFKSAKSILWETILRRKNTRSEAQTLSFLHRVPFFSELSFKQIQKVAKILHEREFKTDEFLFEMNQPGAALFIIKEGEVAVEIPLDNQKNGQLAILKERSFIGELALLDDSPRSASARALKPTFAFAFFRTDLKKLMAVDPEIAAHIYRALANVVGDRLKTTNDLLSEIQNENYRNTGT